MSIRPVDYTSLIPKSQEVSKIKQMEDNRYKNQIEQGVIQQDRKIKQNIKKVRDTNKSENLIIDANKSNKGQEDKEKQKGEKKECKKNNKTKEDLGGIIDIKI